MTADMRRNLGMLVLSIPLFLAGLLVAQAPIPALGGVVMTVAFIVGIVAAVRIGLELMRPRETTPAETAARQPQ